MEPHISVKWPGLLVKGEHVTPDQAAEIIVRTAYWPMSSNTKDFDELANKIAGFPNYNFGEPDEDFLKREKRIESAEKRLGVLDINYLHNWFITSSWVGGPYGWCHWSGGIYALNYNIGKWPSLEDVTEEWEIIAKAFPFLDLRAQVLADEAGFGDVTPTAEWIVKGGKVEVVAPTEPLYPKDECLKEGNNIHFNFTHPYREVGFRPEWLKRGVELALARSKDNA